MSVATDLRKRGETALTDARKPLYAVVGAGELAFSQARTQLKDLPADVQAKIEDLRNEAKARFDELKTRGEQLQGKAESTAKGVANPGVVKSAIDAYVKQAKDLYDGLAVRGQQVVVKVVPGIKADLDKAESKAVSLLDKAGHEADEVADKVAADAKKPTRRTPRKAAAAK